MLDHKKKKNVLVMAVSISFTDLCVMQPTAVASREIEM